MSTVGENAERTTMGSNITTSIPQGFTKSQWKNLDPTIRQACVNDANFAAGIANALSKGRSTEEINDFYKDNVAIKGLVVERKDDGTVKPPPEDTAALLGDKDFREVTTSQWETYFRDRYSKNKDEAMHDMIRVLCHKEVKQLQGSFVDLWHASDDTDPGKRAAGMRLKLKYINENKEKQQQVADAAQAYVDKYKDKLDDPQLITDYMEAFAPESAKKGQKTNTRNVTLKRLTLDDLKALSQFRALNDIEMNDAEIANACEDLAIDAITDRHINTALVEVNECKEQMKQIRQKNAKIPAIAELTEKYNAEKAELQAKIDKETDKTKKEELLKELLALTSTYDKNCDAALPEDDRKEIAKLEEKMAKASKKASSKEAEFIEKNFDKIVEVSALAQVQIDMQKHKYETTPPPLFTNLDPDVQELVKKNPALFCDEITDPDDKREATVTTTTGKKFVFNPDKFKEKMLEYSQAGKTSGDAQTNQEGCDYFCDLQESDRCFEGVVFGSLADGQKTKRSVIKKAMEAAGITTEADKTTQMRIAHVLKSAGIGALSGAGALFVSDFMATLRTCEFTEKIYELAALTKMIPYEASWSFDKTYHLEGDDATWNFDKTYHLEGDDATWNFDKTYHLEGDDATWNFDKTYNLEGDDATWNFDKTYHLEGNDATWSGQGFWETSGTVQSEHSVYDYENGILAGHREWTEDIPYSDSGTVDVSGNDGHWEYDHHVSESGNNGHWQYDHHVSESGNNGHWEYDHHVSESGNNGHWETDHHVSESGNNGHWETDHRVKESGTVKGEVENPDADRELYEQTGTQKRKFHPKFSSVGAYGIAAGTGAIAGMLRGLFTANKVRDEGLRRDAQVMRVVSQKDIRNPDPTPPTQPTQPTQPVTPVQPTTPEQSSTIKIDKEKTPDQEKVHSDVKTVPVEVAVPKKEGNKVYYQGWQTLQKAYGAPNSANFRNWFRKEFLGGKDIWETGSQKNGPAIQHFEREITYVDPKTKKEYNLTFNPEAFANPLDFYLVDKNDGKAPTIGNTKPNIKVTVTKIPGTETYKGSITVKIGDKTYTASTQGHTSEKAVKDALKTELLKQGLSDNEVDKAIREAVPEK